MSLEDIALCVLCLPLVVFVWSCLCFEPPPVPSTPPPRVAQRSTHTADTHPTTPPDVMSRVMLVSLPAAASSSAG